MILQLAKRGGVMGLNFCGSFLADRDDHKELCRRYGETYSIYQRSCRN